MSATKPAIKMPELLLFAKSLIIGFVVTAVGRAAFYMGSPLAPKFSDTSFSTQVCSVIFVLFICITYLLLRNAFTIGKQMVRSLRIDLLIFFIIGININKSVSPWPWPDAFEKHLNNIDFTNWTPIIFTMLFAVLISPLIQKIWQCWPYWPKPQQTPPQLNFIPDEEIVDPRDDLLESEQQAKSFAETVLASGAHSGLVFGVDGPWGIGKTSFINLAQDYWKAPEKKIIVCRFEPLRYASEPDLAERLIREVSAAIQRKVFAPEFRSAASKYSRLIKGKTDVSFLGFKPVS